MKYLVIDAGGTRWPIEAARAEETVTEGQRRVVFYKTTAASSDQVAAFSAPTSWGPLPPE